MEEEPKGAFDPENFQPVLLIQLIRLYDIGLALLSAVDADKANALREMHAKGQHFAPAPKWAEPEE